MAVDDRPETFAFRMIRREKQMNDNGTLRVKKALKAVLTTLVWATRVDTCFARSNWIVTKGQPSTRVIYDFPKSPKGSKGPTGPAASAVAIARGMKTIDAMTAKNPGCWFANNVPYIQIINYKYGDHMVERAIMAGDSALKNTRLWT